MPMKYKLVDTSRQVELIAPLWFAIGTAAVTHALIAQRSMTLLTPNQVERCKWNCHIYALQAQAACVDTSSLTEPERTSLENLIREAFSRHGLAIQHHPAAPLSPSHWCILYSPTEDNELEAATLPDPHFPTPPGSYAQRQQPADQRTQAQREANHKTERERGD